MTLQDDRLSDELLRFCDLKARKIVTKHVTLKRWIEKDGFPPGRWLGPNTRVWLKSEVHDWIASRPSIREGDR
jgi:predicted DNA-binding transcriptional regulator AlpA